MQTTVLSLGRVLLASLFLISGVRKIPGWAGTLGYMQSKGLPSMEILGYPSMEILLAAIIALEIIGGLLIVFNVFAAPAAILLAGFCLVSGALFHNFWAVDATQYANQLNHFLKNVALAGGLLVVAGAGRPERD